MPEEIQKPDPADEDPSVFSTPLTRRQLTVGGLVLGAAGLLALKGAVPAGAGSSDESEMLRTEYFRKRIHRVPAYPAQGTCVVILGSGGGPDAYYNMGCSAAVWSRGSIYLVDFGIGMHRQFFWARLSPDRVRGAFVTHLHSDHMHDVYSFFSTASYYFYPPYAAAMSTIKVVGPPSAATNAPAGSTGLPEGGSFTINPASPTPGIRDVMRSFAEGPYAYDNNIRHREEGMADILGLSGGTPLLDVVEAPLPPDANYQNVAPPMNPVLVYQDETVKVSAILVQHGPVFPSLAYRFDTKDGSIVFSGDTCAHENLIKLADECDVLVHEAIHVGYLDWLVSLGYPPKLLNHLAQAHTLHRSVRRDDIGLDAPGVGEVARRARAKSLVLYHLAPVMDLDEKGRPFDIPQSEWLTAPKREFGGTVHVSKDLLRVDL